MQYWELIRRMLQQALNAGELYSPAWIATKYHKDLAASSADDIPDLDDLVTLAKEAEPLLLGAKLLQSGPRDTLPITLGGRSLTDEGLELLSRLGSESVRDLFESMQTPVERGAIQQLLQQLDS